MENALLRQIAPIKNVLRSTIGTARKPTLSRWYTIDVRRIRDGWAAVASTAKVMAPSMCARRTSELPISATARPTLSSAAEFGSGALFLIGPAVD